MDTASGRAHWDSVYTSKGERDVSWFEEVPAVSLDLIGPAHRPVIDIGGGASRLVDSLLARGFTDLTVLDLSGAALAKAMTRLGARAERVRWVVADVTRWKPERCYDVWHDRAAFHFLTDPADRHAYGETLRNALGPGGTAIIATFAPDGPERCSGLPVIRHDAASLGRVLGPDFALVETRPHAHATPWKAMQLFQFSKFRRNG